MAKKEDSSGDRGDFSSDVALNLDNPHDSLVDDFKYISQTGVVGIKFFMDRFYEVFHLVSQIGESNR